MAKAPVHRILYDTIVYGKKKALDMGVATMARFLEEGRLKDISCRAHLP